MSYTKKNLPKEEEKEYNKKITEIVILLAINFLVLSVIWVILILTFPIFPVFLPAIALILFLVYRYCFAQYPKAITWGHPHILLFGMYTTCIISFLLSTLYGVITIFLYLNIPTGIGICFILFLSFFFFTYAMWIITFFVLKLVSIFKIKIFNKNSSIP